MPSLALTWAQRLTRIFGIDIETSREYGGAVKVIPKALAMRAGQALACIKDPVVFQKTLDHLRKKAEPNALTPGPKLGRRQPADRWAGSTDAPVTH